MLLCAKTSFQKPGNMRQDAKKIVSTLYHKLHESAVFRMKIKHGKESSIPTRLNLKLSAVNKESLLRVH